MAVLNTAEHLVGPTQEYEDWYRNKLGAGEEQVLARWHHQAIPFLPEVAGKRVLDMGSGVGTFSRYLAGRGANVVAADFSAVAIEYANDVVLKDIHNASAVVADIHAIPFEDETFDLTICSSTLEHVVDPKTAMSELTRVTKRGGVLLILLPNYLNFVGILRVLKRLKGNTFREIGQPINHPLMLPVVAWKVRRAGFRITAIDGERHFLRIPFKQGKKRVALDWLERPLLRPISKWFGLHGLIRGTRLPA
jgi:SAM-dependent methyltransferase